MDRILYKCKPSYKTVFDQRIKFYEEHLFEYCDLKQITENNLLKDFAFCFKEYDSELNKSITYISYNKTDNKFVLAIFKDNTMRFISFYSNFSQVFEKFKELL